MLSKTDKDILSLLEIDSRMSLSKLSKNVGLSVEGVKRAIKRLERDKIILNYYATLNHRKLGIRILQVYLKLNNLTLKNEVELILKKNKSVIWYKFCQGSYDLAISLKADAEDLFIELFDYVLEKDLFYVTEAFEVGKTFLKKDSFVFKTFDALDSEVVLKKEELKVLNGLRKNCRRSLIELSEASGLAVSSFKNIMMNLQKKEIITGFKTKISTKQLGLFSGTMLINMKGGLDRLLSYCKKRGDFTYAVKLIGKFDLSLTFNAKDINQINFINKDLVKKFPEVKRIETVTLFE
jgi:DNA-binding Lrp family transcriptional regulator